MNDKFTNSYFKRTFNHRKLIKFSIFLGVVILFFGVVQQTKASSIPCQGTSLQATGPFTCQVIPTGNPTCDCSGIYSTYTPVCTDNFQPGNRACAGYTANPKICTCNVPTCTPVQGITSDWSTCTAACGGGTCQQTRNCNGASCGGNCNGASLTQNYTNTAYCPPTPPICVPDSSCTASAPACGSTTTGVNNCGGSCSRTGVACSLPPSPPICVPNGSCTASTPSCGNTTFGTDNCGNGCTKTGGTCACVPNGSCTASAPSCGSTTTGVDNCGGSCSRTGVACSSTTGTLVPASTSCTISAGGNSCSVSLSWTTSNPVGTSAVTSSYPSANTTVATGNNGSNVPLTVPYASSPRTFYLYNNSALLAQSTGTANCVSGTSWDVPSSTCKVSAPTAMISASPLTVPYNTPSFLNWSYANATSCTITPPGTIGGYPTASGSVSTGNLTVSRTYTISCNPGPVVSNATVTVQPQPGYNLFVTKSGQGAVTNSPAGTNCGSDCFHYVVNTAVNVTAAPASGRIFTGWSGDCTGVRTCSLIMTESKSVIANFAVDPNFREF